MTSLKEVIAANASLPIRYDSVTAIFTGATQGIGLGTLKAFARHIPHPTAVIVGRQHERFERELKNLKLCNPRGNFIFVEGQVSLIKGIDTISSQITHELSTGTVDFVFMAQGSAPIEGRRYTNEALDEMMALIYYGRVRLVQNLIAMGMMRSNARIVSIAVGGKEGKIFEDDLALEKNYSILNMRGQISSMTTLTFDRLAEQNLETTFVHAFPGRVNTGLFTRSIQGWLLWLFFAYILEPLIFLGAMTPEDCGERMLWIATSEELERGSHSVDYDGTRSKSKWLEHYRLNASIIDRIYTHVMHVFETATGLSP